MRLICFWCFLMAAVVRAQNDPYYAPQTFKGPNFPQRELFSPARNDVSSQSTTVTEPWRHPAPVNEGWRDHNSGPGNIIPKSEPWRQPYGLSKQQQASILHHKQSLTSDGAFRFEYASDNGLAAGEQIEPDGSRVGAYQYKDPNGQIVKLKYRAGKDGFQILEGSHLPKSPEPVAPVKPDDYHNVQAYNQQRHQYELQQQYNQQRPAGQVQTWGHNQDSEDNQRPAGNQYFINNWRPQPGQNDGQYRDNEVDPNKPHNFGEGYAFAFKG
ncbi:unnamed protein product [Arctia plantaginis]|uniref:Uncharacterized protein n=1 Tax=Arctia plantaginis TaxID=874455 RepID=A0A8S0ZH82_ARCPL|nr:unnamed protein product [Arctia plantaginis]